LAVWYLVHTTNANLEARHIATGFGFLSQTAPIPIGESLISYEPSVSTYARALLVGLLNTLKVSLVGIVLATVLGVAVGVAQLSKNWLAAKISAVYVEIVRDTPPLLQLLLWYGLLQGLPGTRQAWHPLPFTALSNRGLMLPAPHDGEAALWVGVAFLAGLIALAVWARWRGGRLTLPATLCLIGLPAVVWAGFGAPLAWDVPVLRGFNFQGGITITPEFAALLVGLVIYTAAYIAEIVRSGIQAVPKGQQEAAAALGLRPGAVLRLVILPQALRVIIPPLTSEYLNLAKNSSLAVAIGYQDLVSVADTTLNQTGQSIENIGIVMAVFLAISLSISLAMNLYNARIALVTR
jgi:general L-amino acid transport system permease protein